MKKDVEIRNAEKQKLYEREQAFLQKQKQFQLDSIALTIPQLRCLCAWSRVDENEYIANIVNLSTQQVIDTKEELKKILKFDSKDQFEKLIYQQPITYFIADAFYLMMLENNFSFKDKDRRPVSSWPLYII